MQRGRFWFVGVVVLLVLVVMVPAGAQVCGNRVVEAPEECDDGGVCIGSNNAGDPCAADSECAGGECRPFGGDGCAANCTTERDIVFNLVQGQTTGGAPGSSLVPGTSGIVAEAAALAGITVAIPMSGSLTLTVGKERDGIIPAVVKTSGLNVPPIGVSLFGFSGCGCVKGAAAKTCGGTFLEPDGSLSPDCTSDESVCSGRKPCAYVHGPGNTVSGVIGCTGLHDADFEFVVDAGGDTGSPLPPRIRFLGHGEGGAARMLATIGLDLRLNGECTGTGPAYGPDGQFCTPDDRPDASIVATNPAVTGNASASVVNLPDGSSFGPTTVAGAPFSCAKLLRGNPGGARLVSAFALPNLDPLGAVAVAIHLAAEENTSGVACAGDCGGDGEVTVDEIVRMVNIALGSAGTDQCAAGDLDTNGEITIEEIIAAVNKALSGC